MPCSSVISHCKSKQLIGCALLVRYIFVDSTTSAIFMISLIISRSPDGKPEASIECRSERADMLLLLKSQVMRPLPGKEGERQRERERGRELIVIVFSVSPLVGLCVTCHVRASMKVKVALLEVLTAT